MLMLFLFGFRFRNTSRLGLGLRLWLCSRCHLRFAYRGLDVAIGHVQFVHQRFELRNRFRQIAADDRRLRDFHRLCRVGFQRFGDRSGGGCVLQDVHLLLLIDGVVHRHRYGMRHHLIGHRPNIAALAIQQQSVDLSDAVADLIV